MISHLADVPFFRGELAALHAAEWNHFYADWDAQAALAEFLNQKADGSLPATLVLHEGMELVGSVIVVFGNCPAPLTRHSGSAFDLGVDSFAHVGSEVESILGFPLHRY